MMNVQPTNLTPAMPPLALRLSPKELEVIAVVDLPEKLMADRLNVTENTIKSHLKSIRLKLGKNSTKEVVVIATKQGYL